ncbi:MAG: hypothetical protein GX271_09280 [Clostridiales bacterium]|nr:hypothetical protein [Clostridiales bacterium]
MKKELLHELELYIDRHLFDNIIIKESETTCNYMMPMKGSVRFDKARQDEDLLANKRLDDKAWLERFRKKPSAKLQENKGERPISGYILSSEDELEEYISKKKSEDTFTTKLLKYIDKSSLSDSEIYKKAGIDRRHFSKIRCDKYYRPKKTTAIALCVALELNIEETMELLGLAGYSLSNSDTGDLVVKFCIERKIYDLIEVNEALDYFGQKLLGVVG